MLSGPPKIRVLRCLIYLINNFQVDWTLISKVIKNLLKMVDESTDVVTFQQSITFVRFVSDGIPTTRFLDIRSMDAMMSKIIAVWSTLEHFADERSDAVAIGTLRLAKTSTLCRSCIFYQQCCLTLTISVWYFKEEILTSLKSSRLWSVATTPSRTFKTTKL